MKRQQAIIEARKIEDDPNTAREMSFSKLSAIFNALHRSANKGSPEDRRLAQVVWNAVGNN